MPIGCDGSEYKFNIDDGNFYSILICLPQMYVHLQVIVLNMNYLNVPMSHLKYFQVNVTNVGLRPATGMRVELPNEPLLSLVSFGSSVEDSERDRSLTLAPGDSAVLVLAASTSERQPLGRRSGTLVVRSLQIDAGISYR